MMPLALASLLLHAGVQAQTSAGGAHPSLSAFCIAHAPPPSVGVDMAEGFLRSETRMWARMGDRSSLLRGHANGLQRKGDLHARLAVRDGS